MAYDHTWQGRDLSILSTTSYQISSRKTFLQIKIVLHRHSSVDHKSCTMLTASISAILQLFCDATTPWNEQERCIWPPGFDIAATVQKWKNNGSHCLLVFLKLSTFWRWHHRFATVCPPQWAIFWDGGKNGGATVKKRHRRLRVRDGLTLLACSLLMRWYTCWLAGTVLLVAS